MILNDTIIALATAPGAGAIAVIRLSGKEAIDIADAYFQSIHGKGLLDQKSHTILLGHILEDTKILDQVLVSIFKGPHSYTGEDVIEISCHGSPYIQQQIIQLFLRNGCRMAQAGEFTLRAFMNGKLDLSQAEAVADLIASDNEASHQVAIQQMRGGFSSEIKELADELLNFASLIELELDFAEEDVEFADRKRFNDLLKRMGKVLKGLIDSFAVGNVIKNGIPVAIVGEPNVGKSTLLNVLLNEERAIVSEIAGTTRDAIEDEISIGGFGFRFIDTAGIRETKDVVEGIGIQKTFEKIAKSRVVIYLVDAHKFEEEKDRYILEIGKIKTKYPQTPLFVIANKIDRIDKSTLTQIESAIPEVLLVSAKEGIGIEVLKDRLLALVETGTLRNSDTIVTNSRHYDALVKALEAIDRVRLGMDEGISSDLLAIDIREALNFLGEITGKVTSDDLLGNIFANFCIGK
ncbi:tRNA uridine-5-carboxymethylaminomethyl(34) synthesis GTPase MnmE [Pareuzebyella sediminis]|uniref:tRNA uridine-5-carboxymethylaminomethyl(34) synthesis GTPase MnmE n=1 Tax=Pareuzebyella sediminis TaxID=2607998 RepID=UPI0011EF2D64|nr:tRNA uridine-5-carboxymethylaminomethyl(34) synthesis GTPase MnmE [Pareuzebyella sediminis]